MVGILDDDIVMVKDQSEGSRLYTKGNYGYPRSKGGVDLDLIEAAYLVESNRLEVVREGSPMPFDELFRYSASKYDRFDLLYMVYRDLRGRGMVVKIESGDYDIAVFPRGKTLSNSRPQYMIKAVTERDMFNLAASIKQVSRANGKDKDLLYGVVDEEGDVIYYKMSMRDPTGKVFAEEGLGKASGWLIRDRVFVYDREDAEKLRRYGFYGKFAANALQLSLMETCYLVGKGRLTVLDSDDQELDYDYLKKFGQSLQGEFGIRLTVYSDLRERGLLVKTGFKYGTHFRAYQDDPDNCHARFLVHALTDDGLKNWPDISKTVRLSGGVRKEILFGRVQKNSVDYLEFQWIKP